MSFLEICGIIFIAILIINGIVGIISIRSAVKVQEEQNNLTRFTNINN